MILLMPWRTERNYLQTRSHGKNEHDETVTVRNDALKSPTQIPNFAKQVKILRAGANGAWVCVHLHRSLEHLGNFFFALMKLAPTNELNFI
jgi:hypothetical protein